MLTEKPDPISLRAYARRRGVSPEAVSKAVADGRLRKSVVRDAAGHPKIADAELADREWREATRPDVGNASVGRGGEAPSEYHVARATREVASARREAAQAEMAELEAATMRGDLVPAKDVEARLVDVFATSRTRLLGVPHRARQRDATLTTMQVEMIGELIREALEDLAGDDP